MKPFYSACFWVCFIFFLTPPAWAFGPHGNGKIGNARDQIHLPQGLLNFQNFTAPLSYPSFSRRDLTPLDEDQEIIEVEGKSEKLRILIPIGYLVGLNPTSGFSFDIMDRSIQKAVEDAKERYHVEALYDVRIDINLFSILGIYNKATTIIHAKGIKKISPGVNKNLGVFDAN